MSSRSRATGARRRRSATATSRAQIVPVEVKGKGGATLFDTDEHVRADATLEKLAKLKPVFERDGTVTAGNASSINDGAAAVVLMERAAAETARR